MVHDMACSELEKVKQPQLFFDTIQGLLFQESEVNTRHVNHNL